MNPQHKSLGQLVHDAAKLQGGSEEHIKQQMGLARAHFSENSDPVRVSDLGVAGLIQMGFDPAVAGTMYDVAVPLATVIRAQEEKFNTDHDINLTLSAARRIVSFGGGPDSINEFVSQFNNPRFDDKGSVSFSSSNKGLKFSAPSLGASFTSATSNPVKIGNNTKPVPRVVPEQITATGNMKVLGTSDANYTEPAIKTFGSLIEHLDQKSKVQDGAYRSGYVSAGETKNKFGMTVHEFRSNNEETPNDRWHVTQNQETGAMLIGRPGASSYSVISGSFSTNNNVDEKKKVTTSLAEIRTPLDTLTAILERGESPAALGIVPKAGRRGQRHHGRLEPFDLGMDTQSRLEELSSRAVFNSSDNNEGVIAAGPLARISKQVSKMLGVGVIQEKQQEVKLRPGQPAPPSHKSVLSTTRDEYGLSMSGGGMLVNLTNQAMRQQTANYFDETMAPAFSGKNAKDNLRLTSPSGAGIGRATGTRPDTGEGQEGQRNRSFNTGDGQRRGQPTRHMYFVDPFGIAEGAALTRADRFVVQKTSSVEIGGTVSAEEAKLMHEYSLPGLMAEKDRIRAAILEFGADSPQGKSAKSELEQVRSRVDSLNTIYKRLGYTPGDLYSKSGKKPEVMAPEANFIGGIGAMPKQESLRFTESANEVLVGPLVPNRTPIRSKIGKEDDEPRYNVSLQVTAGYSAANSNVKTGSGVKGTAQIVGDSDPLFRIADEANKAPDYIMNMPTDDNRLLDALFQNMGAHDDRQRALEIMRETARGLTDSEGGRRLTDAQIGSIMTLHDADGARMGSGNIIDDDIGELLAKDPQMSIRLPGMVRGGSSKPGAINARESGAASKNIHDILRLSAVRFFEETSPAIEGNVTRMMTKMDYEHARDIMPDIEAEPIYDKNGEVMNYNVSYPVKGYEVTLMGGGVSPKALSRTNNAMSSDYLYGIQEQHPEIFKKIMSSMDNGAFAGNAATDRLKRVLYSAISDRIDKQVESPTYTEESFNKMVGAASELMMDLNPVDIDDERAFPQSVRELFRNVIDTDFDEDGNEKPIDPAERYGKVVQRITQLKEDASITGEDFSALSRPIIATRKNADTPDEERGKSRIYSSVNSMLGELDANQKELNLAQLSYNALAGGGDLDAYDREVMKTVVEPGSLRSMMNLNYAGTKGSSQGLIGLPSGWKVTTSGTIDNMIRSNYGASLTEDEMKEEQLRAKNGLAVSMSIMQFSNRFDGAKPMHMISDKFLDGSVYKKLGLEDAINNRISDVGSGEMSMNQIGIEAVRDMLADKHNKKNAKQLRMAQEWMETNDLSLIYRRETDDETGVSKIRSNFEGVKATSRMALSSVDDVRAWDKDFDGDNEAQNLLVAQAKWADFNHSNWMSPTERQMISTGQEAPSTFKKASRTMEKSLKNLAEGKTKNQNASKIAESNYQGHRAGTFMGLTHHSFTRGLYHSAAENLSGVSEGLDSKVKHQYLDSIGLLSSLTYQVFLDKEKVPDKGIRSLMQTFGIDGDPGDVGIKSEAQLQHSRREGFAALASYAQNPADNWDDDEAMYTGVNMPQKHGTSRSLAIGMMNPKLLAGKSFEEAQAIITPLQDMLIEKRRQEGLRRADPENIKAVSYSDVAVAAGYTGVDDFFDSDSPSAMGNWFNGLYAKKHLNAFHGKDISEKSLMVLEKAREQQLGIAHVRDMRAPKTLESLSDYPRHLENPRTSATYQQLMGKSILSALTDGDGERIGTRPSAVESLRAMNNEFAGANGQESPDALTYRVMVAGSRDTDAKGLAYIEKVVRDAHAAGFPIVVGDNPEGVDAHAVKIANEIGAHPEETHYTDEMERKIKSLVRADKHGSTAPQTMFPSQSPKDFPSSDSEIIIAGEEGPELVMPDGTIIPADRTQELRDRAALGADKSPGIGSAEKVLTAGETHLVGLNGPVAIQDGKVKSAAFFDNIKGGGSALRTAKASGIPLHHMADGGNIHGLRPLYDDDDSYNEGGDSYPFGGPPSKSASEPRPEEPHTAKKESTFKFKDPTLEKKKTWDGYVMDAKFSDKYKMALERVEEVRPGLFSNTNDLSRELRRWDPKSSPTKPYNPTTARIDKFIHTLRGSELLRQSSVEVMQHQEVKPINNHEVKEMANKTIPSFLRLSARRQQIINDRGYDPLETDERFGSEYLEASSKIQQTMGAVNRIRDLSNLSDSDISMGAIPDMNIAGAGWKEMHQLLTSDLEDINNTFESGGKHNPLDASGVQDLFRENYALLHQQHGNRVSSINKMMTGRAHTESIKNAQQRQERVSFYSAINNDDNPQGEYVNAKRVLTETPRGRVNEIHAMLADISSREEGESDVSYASRIQSEMGGHKLSILSEAGHLVDAARTFGSSKYGAMQETRLDELQDPAQIEEIHARVEMLKGMGFKPKPAVEIAQERTKLAGRQQGRGSAIQNLLGLADSVSSNPMHNSVPGVSDSAQFRNYSAQRAEGASQFAQIRAQAIEDEDFGTLDMMETSPQLSAFRGEEAQQFAQAASDDARAARGNEANNDSRVMRRRHGALIGTLKGMSNDNSLFSDYIDKGFPSNEDASSAPASSPAFNHSENMIQRRAQMQAVSQRLDLYNEAQAMRPNMSPAEQSGLDALLESSGVSKITPEIATQMQADVSQFNSNVRSEQTNVGMASLEGSIEGIGTLTKSLSGLMDVSGKTAHEVGKNVKSAERLLAVYDQFNSAIASSDSDTQKKLLDPAGPFNTPLIQGVGQKEEELRKFAAREGAVTSMSAIAHMGPEEQRSRLLNSMEKRGFGGNIARQGEEYKELKAEGLQLGSVNLKGGALEAVGAGMRAAKSVQGAMFSVMMARSNLIEPLMGNIDESEKRGTRRANERMMVGAGDFSFDEESTSGRMRHRIARQTQFSEAMQDQVASSYSVLGSVGGRTLGKIAGIAQTVAAPLMTGAMLGASVGGPVGGLVGAGLGGAIGAASAVAGLLQSTPDSVSNLGGSMYGLATGKSDAFSIMGTGLNYLSLARETIVGKLDSNPDNDGDANHSYNLSGFQAGSQSNLFGDNSGIEGHTMRKQVAAGASFGLSQSESRGAVFAATSSSYQSMYGMTEDQANSQASSALNRFMDMPLDARIEASDVFAQTSLMGLDAETFTSRMAGVIGEPINSEFATNYAINTMGRALQSENPTLAFNAIERETNPLTAVNHARSLAGLEMANNDFFSDTGMMATDAAISSLTSMDTINSQRVSMTGDATSGLAFGAQQMIGRGQFGAAVRLMSTDVSASGGALSNQYRGSQNWENWGIQMASEIEVKNAEIIETDRTGLGMYEDIAPSVQSSFAAIAGYASGEGPHSVRNFGTLGTLGLSAGSIAQGAASMSGNMNPFLINDSAIAAVGQVQGDALAGPMTREEIDALQRETVFNNQFGQAESNRRNSGRNDRGFTAEDQSTLLESDRARGIFSAGESFGNSFFASGTNVASTPGGKVLANISNLPVEEQLQIFGGNVATANRFYSQATTGLSLGQRGQIYGSTAQQAGQAMIGFAALSPEKANVAMSIANGDQMAMARNWGDAESMYSFGSVGVTGSSSSSVTGMGVTQFGNGSALMDLRNTSGNSIYTPSQGATMRNEFSAFQRSAGYQTSRNQGYFKGVSQSDLAGGVSGMQQQSMDVARAQAGYGAAMTTFNTRMQQSLEIGGGTLDAKGYAVGGSLDGLAKAFSSKGLGTLNRGNGMTQYQIQDRQTSIQREQQDFSIQQSGQQLGLQKEDMSLSIRQFYEKFSLNERQFDYGTKRQRKEMNIGRGQQLTSRTWEQQDMSFSRSQNSMEFGWKMEDADRNIRYSRGKQRVDLMREKDREVTRFSTGEGQRDKEEDRFKTKNKWEDEQFKRDADHFEKNVGFQKEEMDLSRKHFEERLGMDQKRLAMQESAHGKQIKWIAEERALEDQNRVLSRQFNRAQQEIQIQMANTQAGMAIRQQELSNAMAGYNQAAQVNLQFMQTQLQLTPQMQAMAAGVNNVLSAIISRFPMIAQNLDTELNKLRMVKLGSLGGGGPREAAAFAEGGYTGDGGKYEEAGTVHKGEYVIPAHGAPIVMGGNKELLAVMREVVGVLKDIRKSNSATINAVIHTSAPQVRAEDLKKVAYNSI